MLVVHLLYPMPTRIFKEALNAFFYSFHNSTVAENKLAESSNLD